MRDDIGRVNDTADPRREGAEKLEAPDDVVEWKMKLVGLFPEPIFRSSEAAAASLTGSSAYEVPSK